MMRKDVNISKDTMILDVSLMDMSVIKEYVKSFMHLMGIERWNTSMYLKGDFTDIKFCTPYGMDIDFKGENYELCPQNLKLGTKYFRADYKYKDLKKGVKDIPYKWESDSFTPTSGGNPDEDYTYYKRTGIFKPQDSTWNESSFGYAHLYVKEK